MQAIIGTVGFVAATSIINSITSVSSSIYSLISHIQLSKNNNQNEILQMLNRTDIETTIKLLHTIIIEIPEYYNTKSSVITVLQNLQEIIELIENEIKEIHHKILYNSTFYFFSSWRSYDCKHNLDSIEIKIKIFDKRCDNLFKILKMFKNTLT